jgi:uncharacterized protein with HEPN domain
VRDARERLRDILEANERIERYVARGLEAFQQDELIQVWIVHYLQIIGEAASRLGGDFHRTHPAVPWREIVAMRNVLVHEYFGIDLDQVWRTATTDLAEFKRVVEELLLELEERS